MKSLEHRFPPPIVALFVAGLQCGVRRFTPAVPIPDGFRVATAIGVSLVSLAVAVAGIVAFRRVRTTINPVRIEDASTLVSGGIYRLTRNPMYVGLTGQLLAFAIYLGTPWALIGPILFAGFIHRFQILPEERAMAAKFGKAYDEYRRNVRRWI